VVVPVVRSTSFTLASVAFADVVGAAASRGVVRHITSAPPAARTLLTSHSVCHPDVAMNGPASIIRAMPAGM
jgi:hypothetical protein